MIDTILGTLRDLHNRGKSILLIEHNIDAVTSICDRVIFMDAGQKITEGTAEQVHGDPRVIEAYID